MIKSRPQAGHRRTMSSAQLSAHSVSSLCAGTQSGINRIVTHGALHSPALTCQDLSRKQSSFRLKKNPTGREYRFSAIAFQGCDSKDWPLIKDKSGFRTVFITGANKRGRDFRAGRLLVRRQQPTKLLQAHVRHAPIVKFSFVPLTNLRGTSYLVSGSIV